MKRRFIMVSAMILLLGSQVDMNAQKRVEPKAHRPGVEIHVDVRPGRPMNKKAICQGDIKRLQDFYWKKYRVRLSRSEAERILLSDMRYYDRFAHRHPEKGRPQRPPGRW